MSQDYSVQLDQEEVTEGETQQVSDTVPTDEQIKAFFNHVFSKADEARRPRETVWIQAWDLYNGVYDWSTKANWQSKVNIAMVRQAVDRAAATFRRALVRMRNFFGIEAESKVGYQQGLFTQSLLDYWFDRAGFISEFTNSLKVGLITSTIILKVWWEYCWEANLEIEQTDTQVPTTEFGLTTGYSTRSTATPKRSKKLVGKLGLKAVDPFKFWVVPGSDGKYVIEQTEAMVADLQELAKQGIYEKEAVDRLVPIASGVDLNLADEAHRKGEQPVSRTTFIQTVKLYHYWGDIFDEDGKCIMRDATFTVVGDRGAVEVLRKPRPNPFFHGKSPYVVGTPYVVPFSTYNRGIVEDVAGIATMITEMSNLIADGAMFDAIRAFEVDVSKLSSLSEASDGVYPGKVFRKDSLKNPAPGPLVSAIDVGHTPQEALQALSYFDSMFQKSTAITEFTAGYSGKGDRTATEVTTKTSQALEGLDDAARTVEETVIEPTLQLASQTIYQFHTDYTMPRLTENFPKASMLLRDLSPAERYILMAANEGFRFKARGISVMLDKSQSLEKVAQFLQIASHIPGLLQRLNVDRVLEEIIMGLGWNPQEVMLQPSQSVSVMGPQGQQAGTPFPPPGTSTPAQQMSAQQGAELGGSPNNPMANNQQGGGIDPKLLEAMILTRQPYPQFGGR